MLQKLYLDSRCNICGDDYFGTPKFLKGVLLSTLSCGHTFHRNCAINKQDEQANNNQAGFIGAVFGRSLGAKIAGITGSYTGSVIGLLAGVTVFTNCLANGESFWDNRHVRDVKGMIGGAVYVARVFV